MEYICKICPRRCGIDRIKEKGYCKTDYSMLVSRAALHFWEEPCISGEEGSGTVFFSGCSLHCVFCQNREISNGMTGKYITPEKLADIFLKLQEQKANNINLVTPGHYIDEVAKTIKIAKEKGLTIPVVYNTGSYEFPFSLKKLEGLIDIYLPDFKFMDSTISKMYCNAADYAKWAKQAIKEMVRQVGTPVFDDRGMMKKGVIVRHLVLPECEEDSKKILNYLYHTYGDRIFISIMNQYTPMRGIEEQYPALGKKVSSETYEALIEYAIELGIENGFIQEGDTARESFIPAFDLTGI